MGRVCRGFLQCLLKLLNFLLILVGIAMIVYSLWMLNAWNSSQKSPAEPPTASPPISDRDMFEGNRRMMISRKELQDKLPAPWFIYGFFGAGVIVLLVTCTGHIAAETASGCCLCFYTFLLVLLLLAQGALAAAMFLDKNWEKDIPEDPTGEFSKIQEFVKHNSDICQWVLLAVVGIEVLSLLLALLLKSVAAGTQKDYDSDEEYVAPRLRQPLINRQVSQQNNPTPVAPAESRPPPRNDAWSTRMREKYGLDTSEFSYNPVDSKRAEPSSTAKEKRGCVIM